MSSKGVAPALPNEEDMSLDWDSVVHEVSGDDQGPDDIVDIPSIPEGQSSVSIDAPSTVPSDEDWQAAINEMPTGVQGQTNNVRTDKGESQIIVQNSSTGKKEENSTRSRVASPWEVADVPDETDNIITDDLLGFDDQPIEANPSKSSTEEFHDTISKASSAKDGKLEQLTDSRPTSPWEVEDIPDEKNTSSYPMEDIVNREKIEKTGSDEDATIKSEGSDGDFVLTPVPSYDASTKIDETETRTTNLWDQILEEPSDMNSDVRGRGTVVKQETISTEVDQQQVINGIPSTHMSSSEEEDEEGFILAKSRTEDAEPDRNLQQIDLLKVQEDREKIAKAAKLAASFMLGGVKAEDKGEPESQSTAPVRPESKVISEPELEPSISGENVLNSSVEPALEPLVTVATELESLTSAKASSRLKSSESDHVKEARPDLDPMTKAESKSIKLTELNPKPTSLPESAPEILLAKSTEALENLSPSTTLETNDQVLISVEEKTVADEELNVVKRENPFDDEKDEDLVILEPPKLDQNDDKSSKNVTAFDPFAGAGDAGAAACALRTLPTSSITPVTTSKPEVQANPMINAGPATTAFAAAISIPSPTPFTTGAPTVTTSHNSVEQKPPLSPKKLSSPKSFRIANENKPSPNEKESREIEMTSVPPKKSLLQKARNKVETDFDDCASYQRWEDNESDDVSQMSSGFLSHNPTVKSTARSTRFEFTKHTLTQQEAAMEQARKLNNNRVRVVPLIFCGLFAIVTGVFGCMYAQFTCHFATGKAQAGEYQGEFYVKAGLWKYSPIESAFAGSSYCYSYTQGYGAMLEKISRFFGILALSAGTFSVVVLWAFLLTVRTNEFYWKLGVKSALAAGFFQCGTFFMFKSEHCAQVGCSMGPGSFVSFLAVITWFTMSYEMHHNSPISAQIKFNKPSASSWWGSSFFPMFEKDTDKRHVPSLAEAFRRKQQFPPQESVSYVPPHRDNCPV